MAFKGVTETVPVTATKTATGAGPVTNSVQVTISKFVTSGDEVQVRHQGYTSGEFHSLYLEGLSDGATILQPADDSRIVIQSVFITKSSDTNDCYLYLGTDRTKGNTILISRRKATEDIPIDGAIFYGALGAPLRVELSAGTVDIRISYQMT